MTHLRLINRVVALLDYDKPCPKRFEVLVHLFCGISEFNFYSLDMQIFTQTSCFVPCHAPLHIGIAIAEKLMSKW